MSELFAKDLFKDQVIVITGGGTGFGKLFALQLGQMGAKISICGRRENVLKECADMFTC